MQLSNLYRPWAVDNAHWGVEIVEGKFKEAIIQIESVEFDKKDESNMLVDFHVINLPEGMLAEEINTKDFNDTMQLIISDILARAIEDYQKEPNGD